MRPVLPGGPDTAPAQAYTEDRAYTELQSPEHPPRPLAAAPAHRRAADGTGSRPGPAPASPRFDILAPEETEAGEARWEMESPRRTSRGEAGLRHVAGEDHVAVGDHVTVGDHVIWDGAEPAPPAGVSPRAPPTAPVAQSAPRAPGTAAERSPPEKIRVKNSPFDVLFYKSRKRESENKKEKKKRGGTRI